MNQNVMAVHSSFTSANRSDFILQNKTEVCGSTAVQIGTV